MKAEAKLYVYKGEWGLPSIDFECLRTLCLVKFSGAPVVISIKGNPLFSGGGKLPYLQADGKKYVGYQQIANYLTHEGYVLNKNFKKDVLHLSAAYENLIFDNLHPYFYYIMFGDPQNVDATRTLYAKRTPFPFNFFYPGKYIKDADKVTQVFAGFSIHEKLELHASEQIIYNAKRCINILAEKFQNKKFFFGDSPSEFDAILYAYCAILYHITLPVNPLQSHIRECSNIVKFIDRVTKLFFSTEGFSSKTSQPQKGESATILTPTEQDFLANKKKTQILSGIVAVVAMSAYAAWTGLLKITYDSNYEENFSYEEDDDIGPDS